MKKTLAKLVIFLFLSIVISACGNSSFLKQKYTKLKSIPTTKSEQVEVNDVLNEEESLFQDNSYNKHTELPNETNKDVPKQSAPSELKPNYSNDYLDQFSDQQNTEVRSNSFPSINKQFKKREKEEKSKNAKLRYGILASLILAYIFLIGVFILNEFAIGVPTLLAVGLFLFSSIFGAISLMLGLELRKIRNSKKDTVWMYIGIIGGSVFLGSGLLYIFRYTLGFLF